MRLLLTTFATLAFIGASPAVYAEETTGTVANDTEATTETQSAESTTTESKPMSFTTPGGTQVTEIKIGDGAEVVKGSTAVVHYTGTLLDGTKFDSSKDRNSPFAVENVGEAGVIRGWNEGLLGMRVGGTRRLVIPASSGYGQRGAPPVIPPNATLVFEIECLEVR
jgi:peptidylprolyl isomerase